MVGHRFLSDLQKFNNTMGRGIALEVKNITDMGNTDAQIFEFEKI